MIEYGGILCGGSGMKGMGYWLELNRWFVLIWPAASLFIARAKNRDSGTESQLRTAIPFNYTIQAGVIYMELVKVLTRSTPRKC